MTAPSLPAMTDEQIDALLPEHDGAAEHNSVRVEVQPGMWATEYNEVEAWSLPLVRQTARAIIAARDAQWAARVDAAVRDERERLQQSVPEGCSPADAAVLRDANHALADESHRLLVALTAISTAENSAHALEYVKGIARSTIRARTKT